MIPFEAIIPAVLLGMAVGIYIARRPQRPAPTQPARAVEHMIFVIAPSIREGKTIVEQLQSGFLAARDLTSRN